MKKQLYHFVPFLGSIETRKLPKSSLNYFKCRQNQKLDIDKNLSIKCCSSLRVDPRPSLQLYSNLKDNQKRIKFAIELEHLSKNNINKLGLSWWAKLSLGLGYGFIEICFIRVEIILNECPNVFLKLNH